MTSYEISAHLTCDDGSHNHVIEDVEDELHDHECINCDLRVYGWDQTEDTNIKQPQ